MIKNWLAKRKQAKYNKQHKRGFDYAACELLLKGSPETVTRLEQEADSGRAYTWGEDTGFDDGIDFAIACWNQRMEDARRT